MVPSSRCSENGCAATVEQLPGNRAGILGLVDSHALPLVVLGIALVFRLWRLAEVPVALSHDEAYYAVNAIDILDGHRPIYFEANNGREALFVYLVAASFSVLGIGPVEIRLVSVLAGTITAWLVYATGSRLFGRRVALLWALLVAISFWPVYTSRLGLRASLLPPLAVLLAYSLWRWYEDASGRTHGMALIWSAVAGLSVGLSLHTYTAAWFVPLIPIGFFVSIAATKATPVRLVLPAVLISGAVTVLVFAPLAVYFVNHPDAVTRRGGQVNDLRFIIEHGDFRPLIEDTTNTLGMFSIRGDPSMRYNLAGRPVFDPLSSVFFYIGLVSCLLAVRPRKQVISSGAHPEKQEGERWRAAATLVVIWLGVGLLPSATTGESPHFLRAIGAQPVSYVFPALGLVVGHHRLVKHLRLSSQLAGRTLIGTTILLLALTSSLTARDYFVSWNEHPLARHIYGAPYAAAARLLEEPLGERTFIAAEYPADIDRFVLNILLGNQRPAVSWFDGRLALVLPSGGTGTYLFAHGARPPTEILSSYFPQTETDGSDELLRAHGSFDLSSIRSIGQGVRLGDCLELIGYDLPDEATIGEKMRVTLYSRVLCQPPEDLALYVHLLGSHESLWSQRDGLGYPYDQWHVGDILIQWHDLELRPGTPPGDYLVTFGGYTRSFGQRLPIQSDGQVDDRLRLGAVRVIRAQDPSRPLIQTPVDALFGNSIRLLGYDLNVHSVVPGRALSLTLYWECIQAVAEDYTVFNHLTRDDGPPTAQTDGPPAFGGFPTSEWRPGDIIHDHHELVIPEYAPPGRYWLVTGLYVAPDGPRLPLSEQPQSSLERLAVWLERHTPYLAGSRPYGDRFVLQAVDLAKP